MVIANKTRGSVLAQDYSVCRSIWSQARGLMFSRRRNLVFVFKHDKHVPLHMMFVFYPIDVLYLDSHRRVVELKESFRPFTFYNPRMKARYVLELNKGSIRKTGTMLGHTIEFDSLYTRN